MFSALEATLLLKCIHYQEICIVNILPHQSTNAILHKTRKMILTFIKIVSFRIVKIINPE